MPNLSIKTRYGIFDGFLDKNGVQTWLGIPFAKPPVGNLRWQAPQKLEPSDKTFDAKNFGFSPMKAEIKIDVFVKEEDNTQNEDCLTLNIWKRCEKKNLPVMVFIYGGAFLSGSSSEGGYNGSNFAAANDVVLVTINYRGNIFGFMSLAAVDKNFEDSGYLGTKDQIAALNWIKENISAFGGNPDNITVFGESAGSISTMLLTVTPAAKGLFQKVIPQSGHVYFYNEPEISAQFTEKFMSFIGAKKIDDLMKKSGVELQQAYKKFSSSRNSSNIAELFPMCDGKFLPKNPLQALKDGAARGIKFLTGTTADEWRAFLVGSENFFKVYRSEPEKISAVIRRYKAKTSEEIYKNWLKNRPDTEDNFADFATLIDWRIGQEISAEYQAQFEDVYFYVFSEQAPPPFENLGAFHAFDLPFTFNNGDEMLPNPAPNLVKAIQSSWVAFATTGNPSNEFIPRWEKYSAANRQTMELNSKGCTLHKDLNTENLNALRYVYEG